jgi:hypothetical protein
MLVPVFVQRPGSVKLRGRSTKAAKDSGTARSCVLVIREYFFRPAQMAGLSRVLRGIGQRFQDAIAGCAGAGAARCRILPDGKFRS